MEIRLLPHSRPLDRPESNRCQYVGFGTPCKSPSQRSRQIPPPSQNVPTHLKSTQYHRKRHKRVNGTKRNSRPDTARTQERYETAVKQLKDALKVLHEDWKTFQFSEVEQLSEKEDAVKLQAEINKVLEARKSSLQNRTNWAKCKGVVELVFTTLSPFAKNILGVAANIQSVRILST